MVNGEYFEAGTSLAHEATLECQGDSLLLITSGISQIFDANAVEISQRLARLPRLVHFPDGSTFSTVHNEQMDSILRSVGRAPHSSWISFFETGWRWTLLALLVIPFVLFLLFTVGTPLVAAPIASMVSSEVKNDLDRQAVAFLDKHLFEPSELGSKRQAELTEELSRLMIFKKDIKLLFRGGGPLGPNALALPGGTIIFTDEIIDLADNDGELAAIFIHELGHVAGNHGLRNLIQSTGVTFVMSWMLGDLSLVTDIALVGAPVYLQRMAYSRKFEREADAYAVALLPMTGYSSSCFADMMEKLGKLAEKQAGEFPNYLSSHPPTPRRIAMAHSGQPCLRQANRPHTQPPEVIGDIWVTRSGSYDPSATDMTSEGTLTGDSDYQAFHKTSPNYPREAMIKGIQGHCVVKYTVTSLGTVKDPAVVKEQCTDEVFIAPSIEAALEFKYNPRVIDSKAVDVPGVESKFTYEFVPYTDEEP